MGNRQQSRFIALVSNYDELSRAMATANGAENASAQQVLKTLDSLETKVTQVKNAFQEIYLSLHIEDVFKNVLDYATKFIQLIGKQGASGLFSMISQFMGIGKTLKGAARKISAVLTVDDTEGNKLKALWNNFKSVVLQWKVDVDTSEVDALNNKKKQAAQQPNQSSQNRTGQQSNTQTPTQDQLTKLDNEYGNIQRTNQQLASNENLRHQQVTAGLTSADEIQAENDRHEAAIKHINEEQKREAERYNERRKQLAGQAKEEEKEEGSFFKRHARGVQTAAQITSLVNTIGGTIAQAIAPTIEVRSDSDAEWDKVVSGAGQLATGLGSVAEGFAQGGWVGAITAAVTQLPTFYNGVKFLIDGFDYTAAERYAKAIQETKAAQEKYIKAQAETKSLETTIDNIKNLEKAMYNSQDDMNKYAMAVNNAAESYPALVAGYDAAGNAIIDLNAAEEELLNLRLAQADAAIKLSEAEVTEAEAKVAALEANTRGSKMFGEAVQEVLSNDVSIISGAAGSSLMLKNSRGQILDIGYTEWSEKFDPGGRLAAFIQAAETTEGISVDSGKDYVTITIDDDNIASQITEGFNSKFFSKEGPINIYGLEQHDSRDNFRTLLNTQWGDFHPEDVDDIFQALDDANKSLIDSNMIKSAKQFFGGYDEILRQVEEVYNDAINAGKSEKDATNLARDKFLELFNNYYSTITQIIDTTNSTIYQYYENAASAVAEKSALQWGQRNNAIFNDRAKTIMNSNLISDLVGDIMSVKAVDTQWGNIAEWYKNQPDEFAAAAEEYNDQIADWLFNSTLSAEDITNLMGDITDFAGFTSVDEVLAKYGLTTAGLDEEIAGGLNRRFRQSTYSGRASVLGLLYGGSTNTRNGSYVANRETGQIDIYGGLNTDYLNSTFQEILNSDENDYLEILTDTFQEGSGLISKYGYWVSTQLANINKAFANGSEVMGNVELANLIAMLQQLAVLPQDVSNYIYSFIQQIDFTDIASMQSAFDSIVDYGLANNLDLNKVLQVINSAINGSVVNISAHYQTMTERVKEVNESIKKITGNATAGMDFSTATEAFESYVATLDEAARETAKFKDFVFLDEITGKYYYTFQGLQAVINSSQQRKLEEEAKAVDAKLSDLVSQDTSSSTWLDLQEEYAATYENQEVSWESFLEDRIESLQSDRENFYDQWEASQAEEAATYREAIQWSDISTSTIGDAASEAQKGFLGALGHSEEEIEELYERLANARGEAWVDAYTEAVGEDNVNENTIREVLKAQVDQDSTAIMEILETGSSVLSDTTIALLRRNDKYKAQIDQSGRLNLDSAEDYWQAALEVYYDFKETGASLHEINEQYSKILEAQYNSYKIPEVSSLLDGTKLSVSGLTDFANALGVTVEGLTKYLNSAGVLDADGTISSFESYITAINAFLEEAGKEWDMSTSEYMDAYHAYVDSIIQNDKKIQDLLKDDISSFGSAKIGETVNTSTFKALGLTAEATVTLNTEQDRVNLLAMAYEAGKTYGGAIWDAFVDAVAATDTLAGAETLDATESTIARIAKEIEDIVALGEKATDSDKERLKVLKNQLGVYEKMRYSQMTNSANFDFMGKSFTGGFDSASTWLDSLLQMSSVMTTAADNGYIGINDYYNILSEYQTMATKTGQTFTVFGQVIDGSWESFNRAWENGLEGLEGLDGEAVLQFDKMEMNISGGIQDGTDSFYEAMKQQAEAWADYFDNWGDVYDQLAKIEAMGKVDLGSIFSIDSEGTVKLQEGITDVIAALKQQLGEDFDMSTLGSLFTVEGVAFDEWLKTTTDLQEIYDYLLKIVNLYNNGFDENNPVFAPDSNGNIMPLELKDYNKAPEVPKENIIQITVEASEDDRAILQLIQDIFGENVFDSETGTLTTNGSVQAYTASYNVDTGILTLNLGNGKSAEISLNDIQSSADLNSAIYDAMVSNGWVLSGEEVTLTNASGTSSTVILKDDDNRTVSYTTTVTSGEVTYTYKGIGYSTINDLKAAIIGDYAITQSTLDAATGRVATTEDAGGETISLFDENGNIQCYFKISTKDGKYWSPLRNAYVSKKLAIIDTKIWFRNQGEEFRNGLSSIDGVIELGPNENGSDTNVAVSQKFLSQDGVLIEYNVNLQTDSDVDDQLAAARTFIDTECQKMGGEQVRQFFLKYMKGSGVAALSENGEIVSIELQGVDVRTNAKLNYKIGVKTNDEGSTDYSTTLEDVGKEIDYARGAIDGWQDKYKEKDYGTFDATTSLTITAGTTINIDDKGIIINGEKYNGEGGIETALTAYLNPERIPTEVVESFREHEATRDDEARRIAREDYNDYSATTSFTEADWEDASLEQIQKHIQKLEEFDNAGVLDKSGQDFLTFLQLQEDRYQWVYRNMFRQASSHPKDIKLRDFFNNVLGMNGYADEIQNSAQSEVIEAIEYLPDQMLGVLSNDEENFREEYQKLGELGAEGYLQSLEDADALTVAQKFIKKVLENINSAQLTGSPAKAFNPAGDYAAQGYAEGFIEHDFSSEAATAVENWQKALKAALKKYPFLQTFLDKASQLTVTADNNTALTENLINNSSNEDIIDSLESNQAAITDGLADNNKSIQSISDEIPDKNKFFSLNELAMTELKASIHGDFWGEGNQIVLPNGEGGNEHYNLQDYVAYYNSLFKQGQATLDENGPAVVDVTANTADFISRAQDALNKINNTSVTVRVKADTTDVDDLNLGNGGSSSATGNAQAKGTLMGELGPELYVTGGRYYVAGQNGAEFVNLPDDAIVFNHLQTQRLLQNGATSRGKPITNEKKATSYAKGNANGGIAMASASEMAARYHQIADMFRSIADKLPSDLFKAAGGGGGGGDDEAKGFLHDLDRWYNLLRQISKVEEQITYQQKLRANMRKGGDYTRSLEYELALLEKETSNYKTLSLLQKSYYEARRADQEASIYSYFFRYDEDGLMQYQDEGFKLLAQLNEVDTAGQSKYTAAQQVAAIKNALAAAGYSQEDIEKTLNYDELGAQLKTDDEIAQNFYDKFDGWVEEMDSLYDSYNEYETKTQELLEEQNQILEEYRELQLSLEDQLLKAIEEREQKVIDKLQDETDALKDASDKYIKGLSEALSKEREMYQKNQSDTELTRMMRQLAILQRSGGSASAIQNLQNQIGSRLQDQYFENQQSQIDAIQEASDKQLEALQHQIDIMTETLAYQKENGLFWDEISDKLNNWTPEELTQFVIENNAEFAADSLEAQNKFIETTMFDFEKWYEHLQDYHKFNEFYDQISMDTLKNEYGINTNDANMVDRARSTAKVAYQRYLAENIKGGETGEELAAIYEAAEAAALEALKNDASLHPARGNSVNNALAGVDTIGGSSSGGGGGSNNAYTAWKNAQTNLNKALGALTAAEGAIQVAETAYKSKMLSESDYFAKVRNATPQGYQSYSSRYLAGMSSDSTVEKAHSNYDIAKANYDKALKALKDAEEAYKKVGGVIKYKEGGLNDYTGLAMLHGTPSKPEAVLTAAQTHVLRNDILGHSSDSLLSLLLDFRDSIDGMAGSDTYGSIDRSKSIVIENAAVNMNVQSLASDYDARRAGEAALDEMMRIARKTSVQNIRR